MMGNVLVKELKDVQCLWTKLGSDKARVVLWDIR